MVDDRRLFEKLCLEGFQAGLSWLTILRKREGFRRAFAGFDPAAVAGFGPTTWTGCWPTRPSSATGARSRPPSPTPGRRSRSRTREGSLAALVWRFEPAAGPPPTTLADLPATTPESVALSR